MTDFKYMQTFVTDLPFISEMQDLKKVAPDLFVTNFFRYVQRKVLPCLVAPKDVKAWRQFTFIDKEGKETCRQLLPFPPIPDVDPLTIEPDDCRVKYWFGSCNNTYPYVGLIINELCNKDVYPYIPKCKRFNTVDDYNKYFTVPEYSGTKYSQMASSKVEEKTHVWDSTVGTVEMRNEKFYLCEKKNSSVDARCITRGIDIKYITQSKFKSVVEALQNINNDELIKAITAYRYGHE
jgi:hypothetical protein